MNSVDVLLNSNPSDVTELRQQIDAVKEHIVTRGDTDDGDLLARLEELRDQLRNVSCLEWLEEPVTAVGLTVPAWIDQDIDCRDVNAVVKGGCESGAYVDAVTPCKAVPVMTDHGCDVCEYLTEYSETGALPVPPSHLESWGEVNCFYLSEAVELWCAFNIESDAIEYKENALHGYFSFYGARVEFNDDLNGYVITFDNGSIAQTQYTDTNKDCLERYTEYDSQLTDPQSGFVDSFVERVNSVLEGC